MNHRLFLLLLISFQIGCKFDHKISEDIQKEVNQLNTIEKQRNFLEKIGELDQKVRKDETKVMQKYGFKSEEHKDALQEMMDTDTDNLKKVEAYLQTYGHPSKDKHGEEACGTPWLVIHHASGGVETRRRNFKYIYDGLKNGGIGEGTMAFYLNRMYGMQFGSMIQWNRPFRVEEELDTLYRSLNLLPIIEELDLQK